VAVTVGVKMCSAPVQNPAATAAMLCDARFHDQVGRTRQEFNEIYGAKQILTDAPVVRLQWWRVVNRPFADAARHQVPMLHLPAPHWLRGKSIKTHEG
jgi:hypothetical protein